jgi:hypothetical protein
MDSFWAPSLIVLAVGLAWTAAGTLWARRRARLERDRRRDAPPLSGPARTTQGTPAPAVRQHGAEPTPRTPIVATARAGATVASAFAWPAARGSANHAQRDPDTLRGQEPATTDDVGATTAPERGARSPARRAPRSSDLAA